ncbi:MAG TPA: hypothetical protein VJ453_11585 [Terriglobales bacterium]|nr:hypothetical protein [Terriglobales bacterium]
MTLVLFTTIAPDPLAEELSRQGHTVYEALAAPDEYALAEQHPAATIIITADVHPEQAKAIQHHHPTLHLQPNATVKDIMWEASTFKGAIIQ